MTYLESKEELDNFIKKFKINIKDIKIKKIIKNIGISEKSYKIFAKISIFIFFIVFIFVVFDSGLDSIFFGLLAGAVFAFPFFAISGISAMLLEYQIKKVENYIYDNYIKNNIKSFNSISLLKDYSFEVIEDLAFEDIETSDSKKFFAFKAFELNAEGYVISHKNKYSTTSGLIKRGEMISSSIHSEYEVIFIKNIKKKDNIDYKNDKIENNKDLNYWFNLKQKGAITNEEYEQKKRELL